MQNGKKLHQVCMRHNPYFNRWFSAIVLDVFFDLFDDVTILILIDGFLQFAKSVKEMALD